MVSGIVFRFSQLLVSFDFDLEWGEPPWWEWVRFDCFDWGCILWECSREVLEGGDDDFAL